MLWCSHNNAITEDELLRMLPWCQVICASKGNSLPLWNLDLVQTQSKDSNTRLASRKCCRGNSKQEKGMGGRRFLKEWPKGPPLERWYWIKSWSSSALRYMCVASKRAVRDRDVWRSWGWHNMKEVWLVWKVTGEVRRHRARWVGPHQPRLTLGLSLWDGSHYILRQGLLRSNNPTHMSRKALTIIQKADSTVKGSHGEISFNGSFLLIIAAILAGFFMLYHCLHMNSFT